MRHSLTQPPAASSGPRSPREPAAAFSVPHGGSAETGDEADELLFPGLELDAWLEAAVAGPGWAQDGPPSPEAERPPRSGPARSGRLKAAEAARLNRQRKKQYVQGLESRLQGLAAENRQLRERNRGLGRRLRRLERETGYLRAVLANQSALGRLLSRLAGRGGSVGLRLGSSLWQEEKEDEGEEDDDGEEEVEGRTRLPLRESSSSSSSDHDYALPAPRRREEDDPRRHGAASPGPAGLCLHVDRDQVSVEFCASCSRRAAAASAPSTASPSSSFAAKM